MISWNCQGENKGERDAREKELVLQEFPDQGRTQA
jgi:hypothetical protein